MTADELKSWALGNGWTMIAGHPSLTKPQPAGRKTPAEAVVRMVLKATVVHVEAKKPAGKWEKLSGESYAKVVADEETGVPHGLGLETIPGFRMLMQENRDRQVFAGMGG
jgi:hypothetical protein